MALYLFIGPGVVLTAGVVFPVVGAILMALRTRLKIKTSQKLGIEDWLVVPALALMVGMGIATIIGVSTKSVGYPIPPNSEIAYHSVRPTYTRTKAAQVFWNIEWMQPLALGCIKSSFIFFYRRIFNVGPHKSVFNVLSIVAVVIMVIWMLGFFLAVMLICPGNVPAYWGPSAGRAKFCWPTTKFLYTLCWSDVATDLIVLVMPIPSVGFNYFYSFSTLLMVVTGTEATFAHTKKVALLGVFAVGAVTVAASIVRAVFYLRLLSAEKVIASTLDPNMLNTNGIYWMLMETGLALIAVNLPLLYGSVKDEGVESVVRSVRSFASIVSTSSRSSSKQNKKDATAHKASGTLDGRESIELVPTAFVATAKAAQSESLSNVDVETSNIKVTKSYSTDRRA
ncbi:hypothetical protein HYALB_00009811 [Hymenoscyphus albidus]|uniref:Rhodopsin domain-containing protein n=1 Tax=Hymenoscyphus albidus TaxID=595503 RepID=A0A9N9LIJ3_9HELO|nr:hypothetical protein HYALB_00009811 [Hymenoscyphus albidus]